jgi:hypothetical protein
MPADPTPALTPSLTPRPAADVLVWFVIGTIAIAVLFSASVHVPQRIKLPGLSGIVLGVLAGWGLGWWAASKNLRRPAVLAVLTWAMIAAGEVLAAIETHQLGIRPEKPNAKPETIQRDMLTEGMRQYYSEEPDDLTEDELARWREGRDLFERGEKKLEQAREEVRLHRSFYGYLANRMDPKKWGKWTYPWPALFWGAEVILGSTLGACVALRTWRTSSLRMVAAPPQPSPDYDARDTET